MSERTAIELDGFGRPYVTDIYAAAEEILRLRSTPPSAGAAILAAKPEEGELLWADKGAFDAVDEHGRTVRCVSASSCADIEREP